MKKRLRCILLVDDDEPTNFLNKLIVEEMDCAEHVQIAEGGQKALEYITKTGAFSSEHGQFPKPDLIFLDINMPAMDGWEFLSHYHELDTLQKSKRVIVMLTTSFNPDDELKAQRIEEISGFQSKPLTTEMLEKILRENFPENF